MTQDRPEQLRCASVRQSFYVIIDELFLISIDGGGRSPTQRTSEGVIANTVDKHRLQYLPFSVDRYSV
jgi:hypothetical protein